MISQVLRACLAEKTTRMSRNWLQVQAMPWPDDLIATVNAMLFESDDETRAKRKNIARYVTLSLILGWRNISSAVLKQFPNFDSLVESGLLQVPRKHNFC